MSTELLNFSATDRAFNLFSCKVNEQLLKTFKTKNKNNIPSVEIKTNSDNPRHHRFFFTKQAPTIIKIKN